MFKLTIILLNFIKCQCQLLLPFVKAKKAKAGAYVVAPECRSNISAGQIFGVAKDSMGGSDAIVWKDVNTQETWGHTCKESLCKF